MMDCIGSSFSKAKSGRSAVLGMNLINTSSSTPPSNETDDESEGGGEGDRVRPPGRRRSSGSSSKSGGHTHNGEGTAIIMTAAVTTTTIEAGSDHKDEGNVAFAVPPTVTEEQEQREEEFDHHHHQRIAESAAASAGREALECGPSSSSSKATLGPSDGCGGSKSTGHSSSLTAATTTTTWSAVARAEAARTPPLPRLSAEAAVPFSPLPTPPPPNDSPRHTRLNNNNNNNNNYSNRNNTNNSLTNAAVSHSNDDSTDNNPHSHKAVGNSSSVLRPEGDPHTVASTSLSSSSALRGKPTMATMATSTPAPTPNHTRQHTYCYSLNVDGRSAYAHASPLPASTTTTTPLKSDLVVPDGGETLNSSGIGMGGEGPVTSSPPIPISRRAHPPPLTTTTTTTTNTNTNTTTTTTHNMMTTSPTSATSATSTTPVGFGPSLHHSSRYNHSISILSIPLLPATPTRPPPPLSSPPSSVNNNDNNNASPPSSSNPNRNSGSHSHLHQIMLERSSGSFGAGAGGGGGAGTTLGSSRGSGVVVLLGSSPPVCQVRGVPGTSCGASHNNSPTSVKTTPRTAGGADGGSFFPYSTSIQSAEGAERSSGAPPHNRRSSSSSSANQPLGSTQTESSPASGGANGSSGAAPAMGSSVWGFGGIMGASMIGGAGVSTTTVPGGNASMADPYARSAPCYMGCLANPIGGGGGGMTTSTGTTSTMMMRYGSGKNPIYSAAPPTNHHHHHKNTTSASAARFVAEDDEETTTTTHHLHHPPQGGGSSSNATPQAPPSLQSPCLPSVRSPFSASFSTSAGVSIGGHLVSFETYHSHQSNKHNHHNSNHDNNTNNNTTSTRPHHPLSHHHRTPKLPSHTSTSTTITKATTTTTSGMAPPVTARHVAVRTSVPAGGEGQLSPPPQPQLDDHTSRTEVHLPPTHTHYRCGAGAAEATTTVTSPGSGECGSSGSGPPASHRPAFMEWPITEETGPGSRAATGIGAAESGSGPSTPLGGGFAMPMSTSQKTLSSSAHTTTTTILTSPVVSPQVMEEYGGTMSAAAGSSTAGGTAVRHPLPLASLTPPLGEGQYSITALTRRRGSGGSSTSMPAGGMTTTSTRRKLYAQSVRPERINTNTAATSSTTTTVSNVTDGVLIGEDEELFDEGGKSSDRLFMPVLPCRGGFHHTSPSSAASSPGTTSTTGAMQAHPHYHPYAHQSSSQPPPPQKPSSTSSSRAATYVLSSAVAKTTTTTAVTASSLSPHSAPQSATTTTAPTGAAEHMMMFPRPPLSPAAASTSAANYSPITPPSFGHHPATHTTTTTNSNTTTPAVAASVGGRISGVGGGGGGGGGVQPHHPFHSHHPPNAGGVFSHSTPSMPVATHALPPTYHGSPSSQRPTSGAGGGGGGGGQSDSSSASISLPRHQTPLTPFSGVGGGVQEEGGAYKEKDGGSLTTVTTVSTMASPNNDWNSSTIKKTGENSETVAWRSAFSDHHPPPLSTHSAVPPSMIITTDDPMDVLHLDGNPIDHWSNPRTRSDSATTKKNNNKNNAIHNNNNNNNSTSLPSLTDMVNANYSGASSAGGHRAKLPLAHGQTGGHHHPPPSQTSYLLTSSSSPNATTTTGTTLPVMSFASSFGSADTGAGGPTSTTEVRHHPHHLPSPQQREQEREREREEEEPPHQPYQPQQQQEVEVEDEQRPLSASLSRRSLPLGTVMPSRYQSQPLAPTTVNAEDDAAGRTAGIIANPPSSSPASTATGTADVGCGDRIGDDQDAVGGRSRGGGGGGRIGMEEEIGEENVWGTEKHPATTITNHDHSSSPGTGAPTRGFDARKASEEPSQGRSDKAARGSGGNQIICQPPVRTGSVSGTGESSFAGHLTGASAGLCTTPFSQISNRLLVFDDGADRSSVPDTFCSDEYANEVDSSLDPSKQGAGLSAVTPPAIAAPFPSSPSSPSVPSNPHDHHRPPNHHHPRQRSLSTSRRSSLLRRVGLQGAGNSGAAAGAGGHVVPAGAETGGLDGAADKDGNPVKTAATMTTPRTMTHTNARDMDHSRRHPVDDNDGPPEQRAALPGFPALLYSVDKAAPVAPTTTTTTTTTTTKPTTRRTTTTAAADAVPEKDGPHDGANASTEDWLTEMPLPPGATRDPLEARREAMAMTLNSASVSAASASATTAAPRLLTPQEEPPHNSVAAAEQASSASMTSPPVVVWMSGTANNATTTTTTTTVPVLGGGFPAGHMVPVTAETSFGSSLVAATTGANTVSSAAMSNSTSSTNSRWDSLPPSAAPHAALGNGMGGSSGGGGAAAAMLMRRKQQAAAAAAVAAAGMTGSGSFTSVPRALMSVGGAAGASGVGELSNTGSEAYTHPPPSRAVSTITTTAREEPAVELQRPALPADVPIIVHLMPPTGNTSSASGVEESPPLPPPPRFASSSPSSSPLRIHTLSPPAVGFLDGSLTATTSATTTTTTSGTAAAAAAVSHPDSSPEAAAHQSEGVPHHHHRHHGSTLYHSSVHTLPPTPATALPLSPGVVFTTPTTATPTTATPTTVNTDGTGGDGLMPQQGSMASSSITTTRVGGGLDSRNPSPPSQQADPKSTANRPHGQESERVTRSAFSAFVDEDGDSGDNTDDEAQKRGDQLALYSGEKATTTTTTSATTNTTTKGGNITTTTDEEEALDITDRRDTTAPLVFPASPTLPTTAVEGHSVAVTPSSSSAPTLIPASTSTISSAAAAATTTEKTIGKQERAPPQPISSSLRILLQHHHQQHQAGNPSHDAAAAAAGRGDADDDNKNKKNDNNVHHHHAGGEEGRAAAATGGVRYPEHPTLLLSTEHWFPSLSPPLSPPFSAHETDDDDDDDDDEPEEGNNENNRRLPLAQRYQGQDPLIRSSGSSDRGEATAKEREHPTPQEQQQPEQPPQESPYMPAAPGLPPSSSAFAMGDEESGSGSSLLLAAAASPLLPPSLLCSSSPAAASRHLAHQSPFESAFQFVDDDEDEDKDAAGGTSPSALDHRTRHQAPPTSERCQQPPLRRRPREPLTIHTQPPQREGLITGGDHPHRSFFTEEEDGEDPSHRTHNGSLSQPQLRQTTTTGTVMYQSATTPHLMSITTRPEGLFVTASGGGSARALGGGMEKPFGNSSGPVIGEESANKRSLSLSPPRSSSSWSRDGARPSPPRLDRNTERPPPFQAEEPSQPPAPLLLQTSSSTNGDDVYGDDNPSPLGMAMVQAMNSNLSTTSTVNLPADAVRVLGSGDAHVMEGTASLGIQGTASSFVSVSSPPSGGSSRLSRMKQKQASFSRPAFDLAKIEAALNDELNETLQANQARNAASCFPMSQINPFIYVGSWRDAHNTELLREHRIRYVLNVAEEVEDGSVRHSQSLRNVNSTLSHGGSAGMVRGSGHVGETPGSGPASLNGRFGVGPTRSDDDVLTGTSASLHGVSGGMSLEDMHSPMTTGTGVDSLQASQRYQEQTLNIEWKSIRMSDSHNQDLYERLDEIFQFISKAEAEYEEATAAMARETEAAVGQPLIPLTSAELGPLRSTENVSPPLSQSLGANSERWGGQPTADHHQTIVVPPHLSPPCSSSYTGPTTTTMLTSQPPADTMPSPLFHKENHHHNTATTATNQNNNNNNNNNRTMKIEANTLNQYGGTTTAAASFSFPLTGVSSFMMSAGGSVGSPSGDDETKQTGRYQDQDGLHHHMTDAVMENTNGALESQHDPRGHPYPHPTATLSSSYAPVQSPDDYGRILIHCRRGISRSAAIVVAYLMASEGLAYETALQHVLRCRSCVSLNLAFHEKLMDYEPDPKWRRPSLGLAHAVHSQYLQSSTRSSSLSQQGLQSVRTTMTGSFGGGGLMDHLHRPSTLLVAARDQLQNSGALRSMEQMEEGVNNSNSNNNNMNPSTANGTGGMGLYSGSGSGFSGRHLVVPRAFTSSTSSAGSFTGSFAVSGGNGLSPPQRAQPPPPFSTPPPPSSLMVGTSPPSPAVLQRTSCNIGAGLGALEPPQQHLNHCFAPPAAVPFVQVGSSPTTTNDDHRFHEALATGMVVLTPPSSLTTTPVNTESFCGGWPATASNPTATSIALPYEQAPLSQVLHPPHHPPAAAAALLASTAMTTGCGEQGFLSSSSSSSNAMAAMTTMMQQNQSRFPPSHPDTNTNGDNNITNTNTNTAASPSAPHSGTRSSPSAFHSSFTHHRTFQRHHHQGQNPPLWSTNHGLPGGSTPTTMRWNSGDPQNTEPLMRTLTAVGSVEAEGEETLMMNRMGSSTSQPPLHTSSSKANPSSQSVVRLNSGEDAITTTATTVTSLGVSADLTAAEDLAMKGGAWLNMKTRLSTLSTSYDEATSSSSMLTANTMTTGTAGAGTAGTGTSSSCPPLLPPPPQQQQSLHNDTAAITPLWIGTGGSGAPAAAPAAAGAVVSSSSSSATNTVTVRMNSGSLGGTPTPRPLLCRPHATPSSGGTATEPLCCPASSLTPPRSAAAPGGEGNLTGGGSTSVIHRPLLPTKAAGTGFRCEPQASSSSSLSSSSSSAPPHPVVPTTTKMVKDGMFEKAKEAPEEDKGSMLRESAERMEEDCYLLQRRAQYAPSSDSPGFGDGDDDD